jgi:peptidoglycan/LPS O-acetylase OafA/YrhL
MIGAQASAGSRITGLDGLRGLLASVVLLCHATEMLGTDALVVPAMVSVWVFFMISGLVLTRAYDQRYVAFLMRRLVRLWPVFALCLLFGGALLREMPALHSFLFIGPFPSNLPSWTLEVEAQAALMMPAIALFGRLAAWKGLAVGVAMMLLGFVDMHILCFGCFVIGGSLSRCEFRCRLLETAVPQWLGKVSYSLYLCHSPVIIACAGVLTMAAGLPLFVSVGVGIAMSLGVAHVVWRHVEMPSIALSRRAGAARQGRMMAARLV